MRSDGLADLLRNPVQKDFLAVGGDVVEDLRSGPIADEGLSGAELPSVAGRPLPEPLHFLDGIIYVRYGPTDIKAEPQIVKRLLATHVF